MFETIMGIVIAFNIGVMVVETNMDASCPRTQDIRTCPEGSTKCQSLNTKPKALEPSTPSPVFTPNPKPKHL